MNLLQLILKQMRQRLLSTCLTCLSILLGVTLATAVLILGREGRAIFAQTDYGFEMIVGPKASPLQLVMNTIYHIDVSPGNIPYRLYEEMAGGQEKSADGRANPFRGMAAWAVPYAVGDSYQGRRIVATTPQLFGVDDAGKPLPADRVPHYRGSDAYALAPGGRVFAPNKFEAIIGADVAATLHLKLGDTFHATHGIPGPNDIPDVHAETWTIVGILNPTHTANDRVLFIPLLTFYAIFEHEETEQRIHDLQSGAPPAPKSTPVKTAAAPQEKAYTVDPATGIITPKLPREQWEISAILVQTRSPKALLDMQFVLRNQPDAVGVNPARTMGEFFDTFLPKISLLLILISTLVTIVAGVSILVSIYNSVAARNREIAIMRALGATRYRILAAVCLEATLVGAIGGVGGLLAGHALTAAGSLYMQRLMGTAIPWWHIGLAELLYLAGVLALSLLAGLVPALKAYRTPVAENLVAS